MPLLQKFNLISIGIYPDKYQAEVDDTEQVSVFDHLAEIRSPGALPNTMTVERMKLGVCYHPNPLMTDVLRDYRYTEKAGRGILRCKRRLKEMKRKTIDIIAKIVKFFR